VSGFFVLEIFLSIALRQKYGFFGAEKPKFQRNTKIKMLYERVNKPLNHLIEP
jgi:hypothetical protein